MGFRSAVRSGIALDATVAAAVAALELSHLFAFQSGNRWDGWTIVLLALSSLPLIMWRRYPFACLQVTGWATIALAARQETHLGLGPIVATYAVADWEDAPVVRWATAGSLAVAVWLVPLLTDDAGAIPTNAALFAAAWILGTLMRDRRRQTAALEARTVELAREREEKAALAAEAERARIARELHDVLTHSVTVMVVQAQAAQSAAPDPAPMATALARIETIGQETLAELRGLLRRIGPPRAAASRQPAPDLKRLDDLVSSVRGAGVDVSLSRTGDVRPVPAGVALSAYRIVQEALTNTLRHTPGTCARVAVQYRDDELVIRVRDDGPACTPGPPGGQGIAGMRERAAAVGGTLDAGPVPGGGFQVAATLPLRPEP